MADLRARLRTATAPLHERVDAAFAGFGFDHPGGYRQFLRAHSRAIVSLEVALEKAGIAQLLDDWPARIRRHALLADLKELGSPAPVPLPAPELPNSASCWGAAYVLEGSRLGGQVVARRLHPFDPAAPTRYLEHGDVANLWPGFLARLEATASLCAWPALRSGAEAAFELFIAAAALERGKASLKTGKAPEGLSTEPQRHIAYPADLTPP